MIEDEAVCSFVFGMMEIVGCVGEKSSGKIKMRNSHVPTKNRNELAILLRATRIGFFYSDRLDTYVRGSFSNGEEIESIWEFCPPREIHDQFLLNDVPYIYWKENNGDDNIITKLDIEAITLSHYQKIKFDGKGNPVN